MLCKLRTGDIILCRNESKCQTNIYLVVYDEDLGFGLWCLSCGEAVVFFGYDIETVKKDIENLLDIQRVIPKEAIADYFNDRFKLDLPIRVHDGHHEDIMIELMGKD